MKKLFTVALFLIGASYFFAQNTIEYGGLNWYLDYDQAKEVAKKENKPIIILFTGSDWCPPCKALKKEVLPNEVFKKEVANAVLVLADFPRRKAIPEEQLQKNRQLATLFLGRSGLPTMISVDWRTNEILRKISGYNFYKHDVRPHVNFVKFSVIAFKEK